MAERSEGKPIVSEFKWTTKWPLSPQGLKNQVTNLPATGFP
jgi:hypothetical protein